MDNWVQFARARLDELERFANDAVPGSWHENEGTVYAADTKYEVVRYATTSTEHIAANDPAYVLADIAAKRKILDEASRHQDLYTDERAGAYSFVVLVLCEPWASHPEYPGERP